MAGDASLRGIAELTVVQKDRSVVHTFHTLCVMLRRYTQHVHAIRQGCDTSYYFKLPSPGESAQQLAPYNSTTKEQPLKQTCHLQHSPLYSYSASAVEGTQMRTSCSGRDVVKSHMLKSS